MPPYPPSGAGPATPSTPFPAAPVAGAPAPGASLPAEGGTHALLGEPPSWLAPANAVGGFGLAAPSAPRPPTSVSELPLPATPMAGAPTPDISVPAAGEVRTPFDEPPGALVPPNAVGGFGLTAPSTPLDATSLPDIAALDASVPGDSELRALLGAPLAPQVPATTQSPESPAAPAPSLYFLEEAGHGVPAGASQPAATPSPAYDANWRRANFPILSERVNGRPLIWLDNGATTQKPRVVIDRLSYFYEHENSNVHRAPPRRARTGGAGDRRLRGRARAAGRRQSVAHMRTDVQAIGCDWFVFSGHKILAPTGIGALYGRTDVLAESPPWQGGGSMIRDVTFEQTVYQTPPARFEAGTGNIADAVGLGTALDYVEQGGLEAIAAHGHDMLLHATHLLNQIPGLRMLGTAQEKAGVLSFVINGLDTEAIGKELNRDGIAVRAGHHCAQPILRRFGVEASVRATLALYNTHADIDAMATSLRRIRSSTAGFL